MKILLCLTLLYFLQNYFTILKRFSQNGNLVIVQQKKKEKKRKEGKRVERRESKKSF